MVAAGEGASALIARLLKAGAEIDAEDRQGQRALGYAVESDDLVSVVALLEGGASPSISATSGEPLVIHALKNKQLAITLLLLEAGAGPRSRGAGGESLASVAVENGHLQILKELVARGLDLKRPEGKDGGLLHLALEKGHLDVLEYLLAGGSNPNVRNGNGETLVHAAIGDARSEVISLLNKYGASMDDVDPQGWTPLHLAVLSRNAELLQALLAGGADFEKLPERDDPVTPLSLAIENDLFGMARVLLGYGASPGDELYRAVRRGGESGKMIVELLLENGASPSPSRAPYLDSPLGLAVRKGEYAIAKILLDAGAPHEVRDLCGQKPFHVAVARGDAEMAGLLLDRGTDPNEPFHPNVTETFLSLVNSDGIARWALKNSQEIFPIMIAADSGNLDMATQLVAHQANLTKSTKVKSSRFWPLTFATRRSDVEMMQVILGRKPGKSKLWIRVDLSEQRAYVFEEDKVIYKTRVSTGKSGYRTRQGEFVITNKYTDWKSTLYDSSMPYFQRLSASDFGFHVGHVPGYAASHGCIRMPHEAARKLFGMTKIGDYVEIVP